MSDYKAISHVGDKLIQLLQDNMQELNMSTGSIVLASPGEIEDNSKIRLSLFLYQILENVYLKNLEMQIKDFSKDPSMLTFSPLALDLYYMLTSYPSPEDGTRGVTARIIEEQEVLGKAIQILNDNSILPMNSNELHITLNPMSLDDMTRMWTTFPSKPFRSSVCFLVTPVLIDSAHKTDTHRVISKKSDYDGIVSKE